MHPGKMAFVIIDMQQNERARVGWDFGCAEEGIIRLASTIRAARGMGVRPLFVTGYGRPEIMPELAEAAGGEALRFQKRLLSAFGEPGFARYLDEMRLDCLLVAGWVRHLCVRDTAIDAIRDEYRVLTSADMLFFRDGSPPYPMMCESELRLNSRLITVYPDSETLLAFLGSMRSLPGPSHGK
jgi:nicotinamidase-related amidase